jgi:hypothetical protein
MRASKRETLIAFRDACWYSWSMQTRSMRKLLDYRFASVFPGHGRIHIGSVDETCFIYGGAWSGWKRYIGERLLWPYGDVRGI